MSSLASCVGGGAAVSFEERQQQDERKKDSSMYGRLNAMVNAAAATAEAHGFSGLASMLNGSKAATPEASASPSRHDVTARAPDCRTAGYAVHAGPPDRRRRVARCVPNSRTWCAVRAGPPDT